MRRLIKELYRTSFNLILLVLEIFPDTVFGNSIRGKFIGLFLNRCGKNLQVSRRVHVLYPEKLSVGSDVFIGFGAWVNCQGGVVLNDEVMLGPYVIVASGNHTRVNGSYRFGFHTTAPVVVGRGAWIAGGVSLLPGVSVGEGSVVASGAVMTDDAHPNSIYAGIPAKKKRSRDV